MTDIVQRARSRVGTTVPIAELLKAVDEIETLRADVAWAEKEIATAEAQIEQLRADLFACEFKVGTKDAEIEILRAELAKYQRPRPPRPVVGDLVKATEMWNGEIGQVIAIDGNFATVKFDDDYGTFGMSTLTVVGHVSGKAT